MIVKSTPKTSDYQRRRAPQQGALTLFYLILFESLHFSKLGSSDDSDECNFRNLGSSDDSDNATFGRAGFRIIRPDIRKRMIRIPCLLDTMHWIRMNHFWLSGSGIPMRINQKCKAREVAVIRIVQNRDTSNGRSRSHDGTSTK